MDEYVPFMERSIVRSIFLVLLGLLGLGLGGSIRPLPFQEENNIDIGVMLISSLLLFLFMSTGKRHSLDRWEGALFICFYVGYISYLVSGV